MTLRLRNGLAALALLLLLCATSAQAAANAKYLVFSVDRSGKVTLESASLVTMASAPVSDPVISEMAASDADRILCDVVDNSGRTLFRKNVTVDRTVHTEWLDPATGQMQSRTIELDEAAFVVRVPATSSDAIVVTNARTKARQTFDIRAAARETRVKLDATSNAANRLDIVVLGEGYTADQEGKFADDAASFVAGFTQLAPYAQYANYMSFTPLFLASSQRGADHPVCPEVGRNPDPLEGTFVNTALDATFCSSGVQRLLTVNPIKSFAAAGAVPDWDHIVVLVNDGMYGGAGSSTGAVGSLHNQSTAIVQHEFGHSFSRLADEYETGGNPNLPNCSDVTGGFSKCRANVTDETSRNAIKWNPWIAATTPIPTPASNTTSVGLFLGANTVPTRFYRPKSNCMMRALNAQFCEVCKQQFVMQLYTGWTTGAASPPNGIDMIEPGSESPSPAQTIATTAGTPLDFRFTLLQPAGGTARVQWSVDDVAVAGATSPNFQFAPSLGNHVVKVTVTDITTAVHPAMAGNTLTRTRSWQVVAIAPGPCVAGPSRLCFVNTRYAVTLTATDTGRTGRSADGEANPETPDTGYFTLSGLTNSTQNPEVVVKLVEVAPGEPWVFFGGLTDFEYVITVVDTVAARVRTYRKPAGSVQNGFDVGSGQLPPPETTPGTVCPTVPAVVKSQTTPRTCTADANTLCLAGNRFQVRMTAKDAARTGNSGPGQARPKNDLFGFFSVPALTGNANNQELFIKILDARGINGKFWVFFGTLSDFEFQLEILDTVTGGQSTYTRPASTACGAADISGF